MREGPTIRALPQKLIPPFEASFRCPDPLQLSKIVVHLSEGFGEGGQSFMVFSVLALDFTGTNKSCPSVGQRAAASDVPGSPQKVSTRSAAFKGPAGECVR
jgi:hypothetical protein